MEILPARGYMKLFILYDIIIIYYIHVFILFIFNNQFFFALCLMQDKFQAKSYQERSQNSGESGHLH